MPGKPPDNFSDKKKYIAQVQRDLEKSVGSLSEQILKMVVDEFVSKLDRSGDRILSTPKNIKLVAAIDKIYQRFMSQQGAVLGKKLFDGTKKITEMNVDYFSQFGSGAKYKATQNNVKEIINDRMGLGDGTRLKPGGYMEMMMSDPTVKNKIKNLSLQEVVKGSGFTGFRDGLKNLIVGSGDRMGAFEQYYRQYAYDTFVKVDREESHLFAKDLQLEHFMYEGGIIDTSREFCIKRDGKVFTLEEAEDWKNDPWIKHNIDKGYITTYDPIADVGLFGCRHLTRFISKQVAEHLRPDLKTKNQPVNADPEKKKEPEKQPVNIKVLEKESGWKKNMDLFQSKKLDSFHPEISTNEKASIFGYSSVDYRKLNEYVQNPNSPAWEGPGQNKKYWAEYAKMLDNALDAIDAPYTGTTYRGTDLNSKDLEQYEVGNVITEKRFLSTTKDSGKEFEGNTKYAIKSKNGKLIEKLTAYGKDEAEVLFRSNTKFKVTKKEKKGGITYIEMEEVD